MANPQDYVRLNDVIKALRDTIVIPAGTAPDTASPKGISRANGYSYDLPFEHVYTPADSQKIESKDAEFYPKVMLTVDAGNLQKQVSGRTLRTIRVGVMVIIQEKNLDLDVKPPGWRPVGDEVRDLKDDLEQVVLRSSTLGDTVNDVRPAEFETDSDFSYPDGLVNMWYEIEYYNRR